MRAAVRYAYRLGFLWPTRRRGGGAAKSRDNACTPRTVVVCRPNACLPASWLPACVYECLFFGRVGVVSSLALMAKMNGGDGGGRRRHLTHALVPHGIFETGGVGLLCVMSAAILSFGDPFLAERHTSCALTERVSAARSLSCCFRRDETTIMPPARSE